MVETLTNDDTYEIIIDEGETWTISVEYQDSDGSVIPLTGYTAHLRVRPFPSSEPVATYTDATGHIVIDGLNGELTITLSDEDTTDLGVGEYFYDLGVTSGGVTDKLLRGKIIVRFANA